MRNGFGHGNSIRGPASHLALFGICSTLGLTSRDGVIPLAFDRDIPGPMTRTVTDGAKVFNVVAGYDPADPCTELGKEKVAEDYTVFLDESALVGRRIGVLRALVDTEEADPEITALFEQALAALRGAGAEIVDDFTIHNFDDHVEKNLFCRRFRYDMQLYLESLGDAASIQDVAEVLVSKEYSPYIENSLKAFSNYPPDVHPENFDPPCPDFLQHQERQAFLSDVIGSMDDENIDVIVYPSWIWRGQGL